MTSAVPKRTKIIATLGPASDREDILRGMIDAGLNVVRINFSHQKHEALRGTIERVRRVSAEAGVPVAILGDLRGPRIRVGEVAGGTIELLADTQVVLTPERIVGTPERVSVSFPHLSTDTEPGTPILLDDGNLRLRVMVSHDGTPGAVTTVVERGGFLSSNRGINLPGQKVSLPSITDKDEEDIALAVELGFDFLALSFVQSADDVRDLQRRLTAMRADIPVIAKIEKKSALDDIEAIAQAAYGVMVARGDLALEMSLPDVPVAQKRIIAVCRQAARPVITATQMLESMTLVPKPTRAEATDVANAVFDGTDAVMLSGESAVGQFPVQTVATMSAIARRAEDAWLHGEVPAPPALNPSREPGTVIARASTEIARAVGARAIVTHTTSGSTTRRVTCHRPTMPVLALCTEERIRRRLALIWGVESVLTPLIDRSEEIVSSALRATVEHCGAQPGDTAVIVAGTPYQVSGRTNLIKVEAVE